MAELRNFEDWDPMLADYVDGAFNTYIEGPGAKLEHSQQPWARTNRSKAPFKLHVSNIVQGITKEGLINIFCQFGEVLDVFKHERSSWALIDFRKHSEAVTAIHELNMKPPLFLKVQFARSENEKQKVRLEREKAAVWKTVSESLAQSEPLLEAPSRRFIVQGASQQGYSLVRKSVGGVGRGKLREVYIKEHFAPTFLNRGPMNGVYLSDEDPVGPPVGGRFNEANEALLKDIHYSLHSSGGGRTVSKGRGFHNTRSSGPGSRRQSHLHSSELVYDSSEESDVEDLSRRSGRYVYGDPVHLKTGVCRPCQYCGRTADSGCAQCGDFYCSENCLKLDWPVHKYNCTPAPGIVKIPTPDRSPRNKTTSYPSPTNVPSQNNQSSYQGKKTPKGDGTSAENYSPNVVGKKNMTPKLPLKCNTVTDKINSSARHVEMEELKLGGEEMSQKQIPSLLLLNLNDKAKQNATQDRLCNSYSQSEVNVLANKVGTYITNDHKQNSREDKGDTSHKKVDAGTIHNDQQSRNLNNCGQNDISKRNNGPNEAHRKKNEPRHIQNDGNKKNYEGNPVQHDGNKISYDGNPGQHAGNAHQNNGNRRSNDGNRRSNDGNLSRNDGNRRNDGNLGRTDGNRRSNDANLGRNDGNKRNKSQSMNGGQKPSNQQRPATEVGHQSRQHNKDFQNNSSLSIEPKTVEEQEVKSVHKSAEKHAVPTVVTTHECNLPVIEKEQLKADCFTKVKVVLVVGKNEYVVQKEENYEKVLQNVNLLQGCSDSETVTPAVGKICAAPYEGVWYRAEISNITPEIKVYFLDFGNEERCDIASLRCLPDAALSLPAQAIKIKFAEGTPEKYEDLPADSELSVKPLQKDNLGVTVVVLEGEKYQSPEAKSPPHTGVQQKTKQLPADNTRASRAPWLDGCVLGLLESGTEGVMCIHAVENIHQFTGTIVAVTLLDKFRAISQEICTYLTDETENESYEPAVGSCVAAQHSSDGTWHRASVLSKVENGYRVAFCDMGFSQKVMNVKKIPEQLCDTEQFAARCRIIDYVVPREDVWGKILKVGANVQLTFDGVCEKKFTAKIMDDNNVICTIEMTKWEPIPEDRGLQTLKLQNNSSVVLSSFYNVRTMFLRPTDKNSEESYNRILQDVACHAFKAPPMGRLPVKGEIVACQYNRDNNYYRAKVIDFVKNKVVVTYLDFGNTEEEDLSRIKELTKELKNMPPSVVKVQLRDVPDLPINIQIAEYLSEITLKEKMLKVKYVNLKEGVDLFMDGTHINAKLKSFLEPSWQQPKTEDNPDTTTFLYEHLQYVDMSAGEVINMLICCSQPPNVVFGFKEGSGEMDYIMNEMEKKLNEYCNKIEKNSFLPRKSEMCLAEYEGSWYRAACIEVINSETVSVLFIDYGNTEQVSLKSIRKMTVDFMQTRVAVVACTVKGIPDDSSKGDLVSQFVNCVKKVKVLKNVDRGHVEIEIMDS